MKYLLFLLLVSNSILLFGQGWKNEYLQKGQSSSCYANHKSDSSLDNYLTIHIGRYGDAYIKIVDRYTDEDIRQIFIPSNSTYSVRNIPQGMYYLKIAMGKDLQSNSSCGFRFIKDPHYTKGDRTMDFNLVNQSDGYSVPSYELSLDVEVSFDSGSQFNKSSISQDAFNN